MDLSLIKEARTYLDQLYEDLSQDPSYQKSGEELLNRMEWQIRLYKGEQFDAIKAALRYWLMGNDRGKFNCALELIDRFGATEYLSEVEKLYNELRSGISPWPLLWLSFVETVLEKLKQIKKQQKE